MVQIATVNPPAAPVQAKETARPSVMVGQTRVDLLEDGNLKVYPPYSIRSSGNIVQTFLEKRRVSLGKMVSEVPDERCAGKGWLGVDAPKCAIVKPFSKEEYERLREEWGKFEFELSFDELQALLAPLFREATAEKTHVMIGITRVELADGGMIKVYPISGIREHNIVQVSDMCDQCSLGIFQRYEDGEKEHDGDKSDFPTICEIVKLFTREEYERFQEELGKGRFGPKSFDELQALLAPLFAKCG